MDNNQWDYYTRLSVNLEDQFHEVGGAKGPFDLIAELLTDLEFRVRKIEQRYEDQILSGRED